MTPQKSEIMIQLNKVCTNLRGKPLHKDIDLEINRGEIIGIVGASGSGKSVLLRTILGLMPYQSGSIKLFDTDIKNASQAQKLKRRYAVLFQNGALFSDLTVGENICAPMREIAHLPEKMMQDLTRLKLDMVGLSPEAEFKYPSELSGGMVKRAALARALAIDAEVLFLDEPTSGLDPLSARDFDSLIKKLQKNLNLTVMMITHDLDSLLSICNRIAVLVDNHLIIDKAERLQNHSHRWIRAYFQSHQQAKDQKVTF